MKKVNFANNVRYLMQKEGLTQHDLAKKLDVSRSAVAGWVTNRRECSFENLIIISDYFNISIDILLTSEDIEKDIKKHDKKELIYEMITERID
jgi:transcriptional regulator with XRE-family HTH domain